MGPAEVIAAAMWGLRNTGLPVAAVRDADQPSIPSQNIFKLPGSQAPEIELFRCDAFAQHIATVYGLALGDFIAGLSGVDHHEWFKLLGNRLHQDENALIIEAAREYARSLPETETSALVNLLKEASRR